MVFVAEMLRWNIKFFCYMQIANISTQCGRDITACESFDVDERLLSLGNISSQCGRDINVGLKYMVIYSYK